MIRIALSVHAAEEGEADIDGRRVRALERWPQAFLKFGSFSRAALAEAVRRGRREEFARFPEFADPERAEKIPDPIVEATFLSAKLDWSRIDADRLAFYRAALAARREHVRPLLPKIESGGEGAVLGEQAGARRNRTDDLFNIHCRPETRLSKSQ
jgi:1,4-alpha-glucan branching enzyme